MGVLVPRGVFFPYLSILFIIMGLFAGNAPSVFADTTYTYTGNAFDVFRFEYGPPTSHNLQLYGREYHSHARKYFQCYV